MTGFEHTTFSIAPTVRETQLVASNELPTSQLRVWLPSLEDYLYTESDLKTSVDPCDHGQTPVAEDILYDQVLQMEEFDREVLQKFSGATERMDPSLPLNRMTVEVISCGKQALLPSGNEKEDSPSGNEKEDSPSGNEKIVSEGGDVKQASRHEKAKDKVDRPSLDRPFKGDPSVHSPTKCRTTVSSPKSSRKITVNDHRRRREKANEREKQRIVVLKNAMKVLKNAIPAAREKRKITKLEVLKLAQDYISSLKAQLMEEPSDGGYHGLSSTSDRSNLFVYCNSAP